MVSFLSHSLINYACIYIFAFLYIFANRANISTFDKNRKSMLSRTYLFIHISSHYKFLVILLKSTRPYKTYERKYIEGLNFLDKDHLFSLLLFSFAIN